jgi:hypothetical protein
MFITNKEEVMIANAQSWVSVKFILKTYCMKITKSERAAMM